MGVTRVVFGIAGAVGLGWGSIASAVTIEMRPHATIDAPQAKCPEKVIVYETARPYREGGFEWDGMAMLSAIATQITIAKVDPFSTTWVGTLKPPFQNCTATAGMSVVDGQNFTGHSYLRMQFLKGKVYLILDTTGTRDANNLTTAILRKEVLQGNPRWRWGGTD